MEHILVVHDHAGLRDLLARNVETHWHVRCVVDADAAVADVQHARPALILAGASGTESNAHRLLQALQAAAPTQALPILLIVGHAGRLEDDELASTTTALLQTPFTAQELVGRIEAQLKYAALQQTSTQREAVLRSEAEAAQTILEHVLTSLNDHFVMFDQEWRYTYVNAAAAKVLGLPREALIGKRIWDLFPDAVGNQFYQEVHRARGEARDLSFEHYYAPWDRWYDNRIYALAHGISVLSIDITERKRAEAALQQFNVTLERLVTERTAELERSNRELDQFAYVISHDLKSPLRAIQLLTEWIEQDTAGLLPAPTQEHFAKLRARVRRMNTLLDDMLTYSRAGRQQHPTSEVNTTALVHNIVELLAVPQGFEVVISASLPVLHTERVPLETVLRNLISNAIKHHDTPHTGRVTVSARASSTSEGHGSGESGAPEQEDSVPCWFEFTVADNGPGIEPAYHRQIFEIFSTLRARDEVEGSGMGLTVVQKVVETRGGRVWVESAAGAGAIFRFTWPATCGG